MRIGFFAAMSGLKAGGPESYDTCLARGLAEVDSENSYTVYCTTPRAIPSFGIERPNFRFHTLRPSSRWVNIPFSLPVELLRRPVDLFHATYVPPPVFPGRFVYTLLDLSMFSHPELYPRAIRLRLRLLIRSAIRRADFIIAISEFSRQCLLERFGYPENRVVVSHLGVDGRCRRVEDRELLAARLAQYGIREPFILHVGRLQSRKNLVRLVEAFNHLRRECRLPHRLVLVGRESWEAAEIFAAIDRLGLREHVLHLGYVPSDDLAFFYTGASAVAFPSLYEGFGIPVIEAMACGSPVVTSNTTSLPEVAGDAAVLVNPLSVEEIAGGLHAVLSDSGLRARLRQRGFERAGQFCWRRTAAQTVQVYRRAVLETGGVS